MSVYRCCPWCVDELELGDAARRKRRKKAKGATRKTRGMLEAERRGPRTFASLLEEAGLAGELVTSYHVMHGANLDPCRGSAQEPCFFILSQLLGRAGCMPSSLVPIFLGRHAHGSP